MALYIFQEFSKFEFNEETKHNDTYLDHFLLCSQNPTLQAAPTAMRQGCMSKGGVPVQPYFVLGGFDSSKEKIPGEKVNFGSKFLYRNCNSTRAQRLINLEIPDPVRSLQPSNIELSKYFNRKLTSGLVEY